MSRQPDCEVQNTKPKITGCNGRVVGNNANRLAAHMRKADDNVLGVVGRNLKELLLIHDLAYVRQLLATAGYGP